MLNFNSIWDVTPETAHPRATQLLDRSVVWDYGDEDSPLGNDIGADTFAAYLSFRMAHSAERVEDFIYNEFSSRGFSETDWDVIGADRLHELLRGEYGFRILRRDDFIIALAFAQLLLDGALNPRVRRLAITALSRQETDVVLLLRGGGGEEARRKQLAEFRRILEQL